MDKTEARAVKISAKDIGDEVGCEIQAGQKMTLGQVAQKHKPLMNKFAIYRMFWMTVVLQSSKLLSL